ncbi:SUKH-4 family immunity protein [Nonomuraea sp. NPDC049421]|uniref:SUKH-4 family immunity protein n=1 Tax=Nonomuraea sp. NPDC049421 TaxID=3155275 RepID=UPI003428738F
MTGIPSGMLGGEYEAAEHLTLMEVPGRGGLIRFGETKNGDICIDPSTGEVLEVIGQKRDCARLANTNIHLFIESVKAVLDRFPFYSVGSDLDSRVIVANDLTELIRAIDSFAVYQDSFWSTFIDDVEIGDYATEEVLEE